MIKRAAPASRPPWTPLFLLVAGAFGSCLCFGHSFRHLRFDGIKVKTSATLHWREFQKGLNFLAHHLLHEDEAPELVLEPIEVLLRPFFCTVAGPAGALKRIKTQVGDIRYVWMGLFTQPALRLVD